MLSFYQTKYRTFEMLLIGLLSFSISICKAQDYELPSAEPKTNQIIIGGDYNYPPYEFTDSSGKYTGYNVELSQEIATVMGLNIKIKLDAWESIRDQFDRGEIDILQGMAATPERTNIYNFSPHTYVNHSIFARDDSPKISDYTQLGGYRVIVQANGSAFDMLNQSNLNIILIQVETHADALRLLSSGRYDFAVVSNLPGLYLSKKLGLSNITAISNLERNRLYGYATKAGDEALISQFAQGLAILKNTGRQQEIYDKWFGPLKVSPWSKAGIAIGIFIVVLLFISTIVIIWNKALRKKVESRTNELQAQQLQLLHADKMASLGVLVSGVAHEINNPCSILTLNFPFVKEVFEQAAEVLDEHQSLHGDFLIAGVGYNRLRNMLPEILDDMHVASNKVKGIVEDLKSFAVKGETVHEKTERLDLNELTSRSLRLVSNQLKNSTSNVEVNLANKLPTFYGSGSRIEQVIVNLILNACQALEDKSQKITITTYFHAKYDCVVFTIEDQGVGIDAKNLIKLTDPFYTTKRQSGGTGLGLSVSAGIVRDHQGKITFKSTLGQGTKVKLSLPLIQKENEL
ncbi:MAG TPA: transporter substrate-binding domain-containing protein [Pseudoalteromonas sp.]|uniref:Histidine kinase domain-containing protein n=1 Tax=marine sediment metagenome TaxID=412755 RepID=A0A0F9V6C3_9ZZZZ|nr:transporter substrate-binding domain-containing protein [Pseudoalteromonas sp.]HDY91796.1 transporter substrate-binding domain-containing protein [Pseudoalteromonas sp.]HDZ33166.1 transporter substrate-binding domain-containing protein [Pseudoalteromonas sp.]